jgi:uridine phosphorylase
VRKGRPYVIKGSENLAKRLDSPHIYKGFTGTVGGFYGPQGRVLRLGIQDSELNRKMDAFEYNGNRITNLEMETGAIYGLGKLMGHECLSLNATIANRATGTFSADPYKAVDDLIEYALDKLAN